MAAATVRSIGRRASIAAALTLLSGYAAACRSRAHETSVAPIPSSEVSDARPPLAPRGLLQRFPLRLHTRWTDRFEASGHTSIEAVEEQWLPVDAGTWDVVEIREGDAAASQLATRFSLRDEGIVAIGTRFADAYDPYDAPRLWLPVDAHVGQTWKEAHAPPAQPRERACRIDANPACAGGLAVVCTKTYSAGDITVQTHLFCEGVGWTGYSVTVTDVDGKTILERRFGEGVADVTP